MRTMLAAQYEQGAGLRVHEIPVPEIGPDEVLLAVESASICATDIRILKGEHRKFGPGVVRTPGHEITGRIAAAGALVTDWKEGDRVFVAPNMGCGQCRACRAGKNNLCPDYDAFGITLDGGFAEFLRITRPALEQGNLVPVPEDRDPAEAALSEPLACVLHGQEHLRTGAGDTLLVQGAGPMGMLHVLLAKARGVDRVFVSDGVPSRRDEALKLGADQAAAPDAVEEMVRDQTQGLGVDVVMSTAPFAAAQQQAVALLAPGGRVNFFAGLPKTNPAVVLDANVIHYRELWVTGTTGCSTSDCRNAAELVLSRRVDVRPLITAHFPLAQAAAAFDAAQSRDHFKVVLDVSLSR